MITATVRRENIQHVENFEAFREWLRRHRHADWGTETEATIRAVYPESPLTYPAVVWIETVLLRGDLGGELGSRVTSLSLLAALEGTDTDQAVGTERLARLLREDVAKISDTMPWNDPEERLRYHTALRNLYRRLWR